MEETGIIEKQSPSIKLIRNTKGYFFEIKILSMNVEYLAEKRDEIIEKINKWMKEESDA